jgi:hypothetical protein
MFNEKQMFCETLNLYATNYKDSLSEERLKLYWNSLCGYELTDITRVLKNYVENRADATRFPTIAVMIALLPKINTPSTDINKKVDWNEWKSMMARKYDIKLGTPEYQRIFSDIENAMYEKPPEISASLYWKDKIKQANKWAATVVHTRLGRESEIRHEKIIDENCGVCYE